MSVTSKSISIPHRRVRRSLLAVIVWSIADVLRWVNRSHNDHDIRAMAGELTPAEMAAERREDEENYKQRTDVMY